MPWHRCPVCHRPHFRNAIEHRLAYGRQLTCSPGCKVRFREVARRRVLAGLPLDSL